MLQKLFIRNYAIIDELTITFDDRLNVITGETGAGKSIILGAFSLILGERADTSVLHTNGEKCIVEASFEVSHNESFLRQLQQQELDVEPVCIIRRELSSSGKSRAFVNDTPVTLQVLNALASMLVDLHRQTDTRALLENDFRFAVTDAMAGTQEALKQYQQNFKDFKTQQNRYQQLLQEQEQWNRDAGYHQFLLEELAQAAFQEEELETCAIRMKQLSHAEQVRNTMESVYFGLEGREAAINDELKKMQQQLEALIDLHPEAASLSQRMESALLELRDIAGALQSLQQDVDMDPEHLQQLQERMDLGYRLLKKHQVATTADLLAIQQQLDEKLQANHSADEELHELKTALDTLEVSLMQQAAAISTQRRSCTSEFVNKINELLHLVGMPNASVAIDITPGTTLYFWGIDDIAFLLDANKSGKFLPVQKAASGGELSRIMLCIKTLTAKALALPTLIFDEVDTGISGEAARQVGILLRSVADVHQVLCITHQPQVAGKGNRHFYVYKSEGAAGKITTQIRLLNDEEHIEAVARMISGDPPSEAALENARELSRR